MSPATSSSQYERLPLRLSSSRSSAHALRRPLPPSWIERLPEVTPSSGLYAVLAGRMRILSSGTPSSSAAICASAVLMPWPRSTLPLAIVTVPSRSKCTRCVRRRASASGRCVSTGLFTCRLQHRLDHAVVRAAAAQVLVERRANLRFARAPVAGKQRRGADRDAAHAVAALRRLLGDQRPLHCV